MEYQEDTFTTSRFLSSLEEKRETGNPPIIISEKAIVTQGEGGNNTTPVRVEQFEILVETSENKKLTKETTKADNIIEDEVPTTKADKIEDEVAHKEGHRIPCSRRPNSRNYIPGCSG